MLENAPFLRGRSFAALFLGLLAAFGATGCRSTPGPSTEEIAGTYYAGFSFKVNRGRFQSTNYRTDKESLAVPINAQIEVLKRTRHGVQAQLEDGTTFEVQHVAKHTKNTLEHTLGELLRTDPTDLSAYGDEERKAIEDGKVSVGMHKDTVLLAIGPPPAIGTPSLAGDTWKYWSSRFNTFLVHFDDDGIVTSIQD